MIVQILPILKQTVEARWYLMNGKLVWREFSTITCGSERERVCVELVISVQYTYNYQLHN